MKFNLKSFVSGLLLGSLFFGSVTFAAEQLKIKPNPFPILINGKKADIDGYNINNSTYLKLKDFEKAGLGVDFKDNQILVESTNKEVVSDDVENIIEGGEKTMNMTPDGIKVDNYNDKKYVSLFNISNKYPNIQINYLRVNPITREEIKGWAEDGKLLQERPYDEIAIQLILEGNVLIDDISFKVIDNSTIFKAVVDYEYYISKILPLIIERN